MNGGLGNYDAWKLASPDDDYEPRRCESCGASEEDRMGPAWDRDWVGGSTWEHVIVVPFGWCPECGWRCEPCPDIEDAYERGPFPCSGCGTPLYDGDGCVNASCPTVPLAPPPPVEPRR